jgi:ATP-binding cassette subfamily F protein uup
MALLNLQNIHLSFGSPALLEDVSFSIESGERICLIGRNGEGKSTLMKVIAGEIPFDDGERLLSRGTRITRLTQEVPENCSGRVFDLVADGLGELAELIKSYHSVSQEVTETGSEHALARMANIQHELEAVNGWQLEQRVETVMSRMQLEPEADFASLSGGMKRRVLLAQALAGEPQLLLLDEPTNHLDIDAIAWLEEFLLGWNGTLLFVTHDRAFLKRLATRIVELDRGHTSDWPGDYENYLRRREEVDNAEQKANARFDKKMAQEETWIRQGITARRTRNEGRVRDLQQMRKAFGERRKRQGSAKLTFNAAERSGKLVCEAEDVSYAWDKQAIIKNFSTTIMRGDRIGIIGPNGCGKSTLLNLLLGKIPPDSGSVKLGTKIEVAYFDQLRAQLREDQTVIDNVTDGSDSISINGQRKHVIGYLQDFLFAPGRARQPVKSLSGGERNRLLLAKLFTKPANILVMDEPTNDLDVETLELLEELLLNFTGTLLLVSHDRVFLDNAVTSTLVFEGGGRVKQYVGGYNDWLTQRQKPDSGEVRAKKNKKSAPELAPKSKDKLSYKDQRELGLLPRKIEHQEAELSEIQENLSDPDLYRTDPQAVTDLSQRMTELEQLLAADYARWEELE